MTSKATEDYEPKDLMLAEQLRKIVAEELAGSVRFRRGSNVLSSLSDLPERKRRRRANITARATATRAPGYSRPLYTGNSKYVQAIWKLSDRHIASIMARYTLATDQRGDAAAIILANGIARCFKTRKTQDTARIIALELICGGNSTDVCRALHIPQEDWRDSNKRRIFNRISTQLERLDIDSLLAWHAVWEHGYRPREIA
ncbi:MAG: hypothetical protein AAGI72_15425 [Pseudomonadota bacterium]